MKPQVLAVIAAAVLWAAPASPVADNARTAHPCIDDAGLLAAEANLADGYGFACLSTGIVVVDDGSEAVSAMASSTSADDCSYDQEPVRTIISETSEEMQFCIFYGQTNDPVNGSWVETINTRATVNLQYLSHNVTIRTLGGGSTTATWTGAVTFERHLSPTNYQFEDATSFRIEDTWTPRLAANTWIGDYEGQWTEGISSMIISLENMHVSQPAAAFSIDIPQSVTTHRFQCEWANDRGVWPNVQEAPFSGGSGR